MPSVDRKQQLTQLNAQNFETYATHDHGKVKHKALAARESENSFHISKCNAIDGLACSTSAPLFYLVHIAQAHGRPFWSVGAASKWARLLTDDDAQV